MTQFGKNKSGEVTNSEIRIANVYDDVLYYFSIAHSGIIAGSIEKMVVPKK